MKNKYGREEQIGNADSYINQNHFSIDEDDVVTSHMAVDASALYIWNASSLRPPAITQNSLESSRT